MVTLVGEPGRGVRARGRIPVAEARRERVVEPVAVGREPLRQPRRQVVLHPRVVAREVLAIAVAHVGLPRADEPPGIPDRRGATVGGLECRSRLVAVVGRSRRQQRDLAGGELVVAHVLQRLEHVALGVELQRGSRQRQLRVTGPAVLLVGRRVGDDAGDVVLGHRRAHVAVDQVQQIARRAEHARLGHRLADLLDRVEHRGHAVRQRRPADTGDLHVLEALVGEPRRERLRPGALRDVVIGLDLARGREARDADQPVGAELLGVADLDRRPGRRALHLHRPPPRALLAGVPHVDTLLRLGHRARPEVPDQARALVLLRGQPARRAGHGAGRRPGAGVEARRVPVRTARGERRTSRRGSGCRSGSAPRRSFATSHRT